MTTEHRATPRYELRVSAEVRFGDTVILGTTRNLSAGGVLVIVNRPLGEGTDVSMRLFIVEDDIETAEGAGLDVTGRVQWSAEGEERTHQAGVQFVQLNERQTRALARAISALGGG